jgi:1,4-dihydroxy-2-naphthoate polyprenyltransferase
MSYRRNEKPNFPNRSQCADVHALKNLQVRIICVTKEWIISMRLPTLSAGISPVLIGSLIAWSYQPLSRRVLALCFLFTILLQIGTNWINDYFDFTKGADTAARKGGHSCLLTGSISPKAMRNAAFAALLLAACCSIPLICRIGIIYTPIMLLSILCAVWYSGGKWALGYIGLGDLLVLIFYGTIATCFTASTQLLFIPRESIIASLIPGFLSCAILCVNNIRDINEDRQAKKRTLIVRYGTFFGKIEYVSCFFIAALVPLYLVWVGWPLTLLGTWIVLPLAKEPLLIVLSEQKNLNRALFLTSRFLIIYSIAFCLAFFVSEI